MTTYIAKGKLFIVGETMEFASGTKIRRFVLDTSENGDRISPVEFTLKKDHVDDLDGYQPGEKVVVEFFIDARKWDGPKGTKYIVNLNACKISKSSPAIESALIELEKAQEKLVLAEMKANQIVDKTPNGQSMQTAVETWKKYHGDDKAGFGAFCKNLKPGKKSSEYTSADWGEIVAKLEEEANAAAKGDDFDDIPF